MSSWQSINGWIRIPGKIGFLNLTHQSIMSWMSEKSEHWQSATYLLNTFLERILSHCYLSEHYSTLLPLGQWEIDRIEWTSTSCTAPDLHERETAQGFLATASTISAWLRPAGMLMNSMKNNTKIALLGGQNNIKPTQWSRLWFSFLACKVSLSGSANATTET